MGGLTQQRCTVGDTRWDIMNEVTRARLLGTGNTSGASGLLALRDALTRGKPAGESAVPHAPVSAGSTPTELGPRVTPSDSLQSIVAALTDRGRSVSSQLRPAPATIADALAVPVADEVGHAAGAVTDDAGHAATAVSNAADDAVAGVADQAIDAKAAINKAFGSFRTALSGAELGDAQPIIERNPLASLPGLSGGDDALAAIASKATKPMETMKAALAALRATPKA